MTIGRARDNKSIIFLPCMESIGDKLSARINHPGGFTHNSSEC